MTTLFFVLLVAVLLGIILPSGYGLWLYSRAQKPPLTLHPQDVGLKAEEITVAIPGRGTVKGWFIANPASPNTLVLMHGFAMNKGDILKRTYLLAKDCNLFYFDFLGSGDSQGKTHIGYSEPDDLEHVIQYLKQYKPQATRRVALYGISQGAGAAVRYTANHPEMACLIAEATYYSFWDVARRWIWKRTKTPYFPTVYSFLRLAELKLHCHLEDFAPKNTASAIKVPSLLIHGQKDSISPLANARKVYALLSGPKELWSVPEAGHTSCARVAGEEYIRRIRAFLKAHL